MSAEANSKSKGAKAPGNANDDADSILPLLFATIGNPAISFKAMAAMDELGRTESSLEHKFRKWRQKGREIAAKHPAYAGSLGTSNAGVSAAKKPRASAKKDTNARGKGSIEQAGEDEEEEEGDETKETGRIGSEKVESSTKGKATAANSTKKRVASLQVAAAKQEVGDVPNKKAKVVKKGTARVVKKSKAKVNTSSEEEDEESEDDAKVPTKRIGNGKGNKAKAAAKLPGPAKAKKGMAVEAAEAGQTRVPKEEEADVDMDSESDHHDGKVDMQFDLVA